MSNQWSKKQEAWSARFNEPMSELVKRYTASVFFDKRLAEFDIQGSLAHATMLAETGVIAASDLQAIQNGMSQILDEIKAGQFTWQLDLVFQHARVTQQLFSLIV